jgi:hypothetical protein
MNVATQEVPKLFVHRFGKHGSDMLFLHPDNEYLVFQAFPFCQDNTFVCEHSTKSKANQIRQALCIKKDDPILIVKSTNNGTLLLGGVLKEYFEFTKAETTNSNKKASLLLEEFFGDDDETEDGCDN